MSDWIFKTIDELKDSKKNAIAMGPFGSRIKSENFVKSGVPVLKGLNLHNAFIDDSKCSFLTKEKAQELKSSSAISGDIIITHRGTLGQVSIIPENSNYPQYIASQSQLKISLNRNQINPLFATYYLRSPMGQNQLLSYSSQVGVPAIAKATTSVKKILLPCPKLDIQNKIVHVLKTFDDKIQLNTQINQTLEAMAQALFKSWFVDFDPVKAKAEVLANGGNADDANRAAMRTISGKTDAELEDMATNHPEDHAQLTHTASLFPDKLVDSELGNIPEGWEAKTIDECYSVVMGQSPKGETYNENGNGTLFFQGRAEFDWRFPIPRLYTTDPKRMAKKGDVLMSVRAPVGDLNIALEDCCVGRGLCALRHKAGGTSYSYYHFKELQNALVTYNNEGTVFGSINQKTLKSINIIEPKINLIELFNQLAGMLDKEIKKLSLENKTLATLRDTLLPKLLSGELDLNSFTESFHD